MIHMVLWRSVWRYAFLIMSTKEWKLVTETVKPTLNSERAVQIETPRFVLWELRGGEEQCTDAGNLIQSAQGTKSSTDTTEAHALFLGLSCASQEWVIASPIILSDKLCRSVRIFQCFLESEIKIIRKAVYIIPFSWLRRRQCLSSAQQEQPPLFSGSLCHSCLHSTFVLGRNSLWCGYVFHTPGECGAADCSPLRCSLGSRTALHIVPCILIVRRKWKSPFSEMGRINKGIKGRSGDAVGI